MLPDPGEIGPLKEVIRTQRNELGLSQADVADMLCRTYRPTVTSVEVRRWERGTRRPRKETRRALEQVLNLPLGLLDLAAGVQRAESIPVAVTIPQPAASGDAGSVEAIRTALLEAGTWSMVNTQAERGTASIATVEAQLDHVMQAYQASRFEVMLAGLPALLNDAHRIRSTCKRGTRARANRLVALSSHASANVLTKLGELDLAWIAAQHGLQAADASENEAVIGSLRRSTVHTLQAFGMGQRATSFAERSANDLRTSAALSTRQGRSVYGTFLLASAMAAARAGDRSGCHDLLDEAEFHAARLGRNGNYLWTAFGPGNVAIHRVNTAVAADDIDEAERYAPFVDTTGLPTERHVRYLFDLALIAIRRDRPDQALVHLLEAEQLAPEHVYYHRMGQQIVNHLRTTKQGRQDPRLARIDRRTQMTIAAAGTVGP